ncbi:MAG: GNAT family N-acetyltransferase [Candidatus Polarisedimenticolia bacterium]
MIRLVQASTPALIELARGLFREYQRAIGVDLRFQDFERESATLPGAYAPPDGLLLLAYLDDELAGCGAVRPLGPGVAELKRMWTRPEHRGRGVARAVAEALLETARAAGRRTVRLDTLEWMTAARALYASLGFRERAPYYDNPLPGAVFMELELAPEDASRAR